MKMKLLRRPEAANTLLVTLVICTILGTSTLGYLTLVEEQNKLGTRSQDWNFSMALVEAGIEDGMEELNINTNNYTAIAADGWTVDPTDSKYFKFNQALGNGSYSVMVDVSDIKNPTITAVGKVSISSYAMNCQPAFLAAINAPTVNIASTVRRAVRVTASRGYLFTHAMVAKGVIDLNGNNILTDSYDSSDPSKSTNGQYDPAKAGSSGDVMSNTNIVNSVNVGNAKIHGKVSTGAGGTVYVGTQGVVGSYTWQAAGNQGIEPGWTSADANFTFPDTSLPNYAGYLPVNTVNGTNYLQAGNNYVASSLSGPTVVTGSGPVNLVLPNGLNQSSQDSITIPDDAQLQVFAGGTTASVSGNSILNQSGLAQNFILWCAPSVTSFALNGNAGFVGVVVAPNVDVSLNGGGKNSTTDFNGAIIAKSVKLNGSFNFHYDEALKNLPANDRYLVNSWDEIPPPTLH